METRNYIDILSDLEGEGERSEDEKPNSATPHLKTERLRIQKASTSNAPRSVHCENEFTTTKIKIKKKSNINMEQGNESTQVFKMIKSVYERRERDEYDLFGETVSHNIRSLKTDFSKISVQQ